MSFWPGELRYLINSEPEIFVIQPLSGLITDDRNEAAEAQEDPMLNQRDRARQAWCITRGEDHARMLQHE